MVTKNYEYQSDFAKRFLAQGRVEGRLEGEAKGRARAVLTVLAARGLAVPAKARTRILKCTDVAKLDTWLTRAATAASAAEVMDE
jgi:predicted transposase YdaD